MPGTPSDDSTSDRPTLSRRRFLQASLALGAAGATVAGTSGPVRAAATTSTGRSSYTILAGDANEQTVHVYRAARDGPTTVVVGGVHGDERAGYLAADRVAEWAVDRGTLVVLPRAHPDAIARGHRPWGTHDLNRQFPPRGGDCLSTLADTIWTEVERHDPDLVLDLHSSRGIYKSGDGGVGQALFPTWTDPARANGERTVRALNDTFDLRGDMAYRMGNTLDADRDMLVHRVAGVLDRPGYICETTEKAPLDEQVDWHLFTVEHLLGQWGQHRVAGPALEARTLTLDDPWGSYGLSGNYAAPVVLAPAITAAGYQPCHTRVRNVSAGGFEAKVEEWLYQNGIHLPEETGMLATDAGVYDLGGASLEVGTCTTNHEFTDVAFEGSFSEPPVVLLQSQTENGADPIVSRARNVSSEGMEVIVQEEDGEENGGYHYVETVGYLAVSAGRRVLDGRGVEAGFATVDHEWTRIAFDGSYETPVFLASVQSYEGWNTVTVRYRNLTSDGVEVMLQEEQSDDDEMGHVPETVGYLVVEG
jgi:hypothetical protein